MSGYFDIMTFGMGPINLKDVTGATEHFAGTVVDTTKVLQTSAAAAKGINWGSDKGMYRIKVMCDIKVQQKIAIQKATDIEFRIYDSADNASFGSDPISTYKVPIASLNGAKPTPVSFSFISTAKKYFCISMKFVGGSIASTDKATAGQLLITANPIGY